MHRVSPSASAAESLLAWASVLVLLVLAAGVPFLGLVSDALVPDPSPMPDGGWRTLLFSVLYSFVASLTALCFAAALAARPAASGVVTWLAQLPFLNMAVPGIVLGAAYVIAFGGPPLPLTGTPLALLLAEVATQLPVITLLLREPVRAQHGTYGEAARVNGIRRTLRLERIYLPPLFRPLAWAWSFSFCRLFFELPLAQMLAPAGAEPAGVMLVQLQQSLHFGVEARLAVAGMLVCGTIAGGVLLLAERDR
jgi:iron(III) transport system permease protein